LTRNVFPIVLRLNAEVAARARVFCIEVIWLTQSKL
jgi:hypothetical protein